jgi:site-specific DNA recombinase
MVTELKPPLTARNGHTLKVFLVCRVSDPGPGKQDIRSLADQEALYRHWLREHTTLPVEIAVVAGSGSGEWLERKEYLQLVEMVESDEYDVGLTEDLGRILRRIQAHMFCESCVDHRTRLIALNDHVDTCEPGWEDRSIFAAWHHERSNRDTSDRIKRSHRNRFEQGRCLALPIYGYHKVPGGKTDDDLEKIPEAVPIYEEWFRRLDDGRTYSEIADWLNETGVAPGPYSRNTKWDCPMVTRTSHNWLLKGLRFRNKRKTRRINNPGRYKSEKAEPKDLLLRHVPHLAFFDDAYYDRVIAKADARNAKFRRNGNGTPAPCQDRPKKRTRFPGQTVYCGICGRLYVFGGHGQRDHLMCEGAREYKCWNGITFSGPLAARKISEAALSEVCLLEDFNPVFYFDCVCQVLSCFFNGGKRLCFFQ